MQNNIRIGDKFVEIENFRILMKFSILLFYKGRWRFKLKYAEGLRSYNSYISLLCFSPLWDL